MNSKDTKEIPRKIYDDSIIKNSFELFFNGNLDRNHMDSLIEFAENVKLPDTVQCAYVVLTMLATQVENADKVIELLSAMVESMDTEEKDELPDQTVEVIMEYINMECAIKTISMLSDTRFADEIDSIYFIDLIVDPIKSNYFIHIQRKEEMKALIGYCIPPCSEGVFRAVIAFNSVYSMYNSFLDFVFSATMFDGIDQSEPLFIAGLECILSFEEKTPQFISITNSLGTVIDGISFSERTCILSCTILYNCVISNVDMIQRLIDSGILKELFTLKDNHSFKAWESIVYLITACCIYANEEQMEKILDFGFFELIEENIDDVDQDLHALMAESVVTLEKSGFSPKSDWVAQSLNE